MNSCSSYTTMMHFAGAIARRSAASDGDIVAAGKRATHVFSRARRSTWCPLHGFQNAFKRLFQVYVVKFCRISTHATVLQVLLYGAAPAPSNATRMAYIQLRVCTKTQEDYVNSGKNRCGEYLRYKFRLIPGLDPRLSQRGFTSSHTKRQKFPHSYVKTLLLNDVNARLA